MRALIHIGHPKCFSTSLQRGVFARSSALHHLGCGVGDDNVSYASPDIELLVESGLKFAHRSRWEASLGAHREVIAREWAGAGGRTLCLSSEMLGFNFTPHEVDPDDKIARLAELFVGAELDVMLVVREPLALVRSVYRELVRMGQPGSWSEFVEWGLRWQDRNFTDQLDVHATLARLGRHLPEARLHLLVFEEWTHADFASAIQACVARILGVAPDSGDVERFNDSLSDAHTARLAAYNDVHRRGMGRSMLHAMEDHRNRVSLRAFDPSLTDAELYADVLAKRAAIAATAKDLPEPSDPWALDAGTNASLDRWLAPARASWAALERGDLPDGVHRHTGPGGGAASGSASGGSAR